MNFTKNLILAVCFTFNPGAPGYNLFIKPSVYFMPKEIFTNQTNWELVKSNKGIKVYSQCVNIYERYKTRRLRGDFQINMPLPDIIAFLKDGSKVKNRTSLDNLTSYYQSSK